VASLMMALLRMVFVALFEELLRFEMTPTAAHWVNGVPSFIRSVS
jgi:hypothetical protein